MKKILFVLALLPLVLGFCHAQTRPSFEPVAVVELFTSEGCSSCPPADKLLSALTDETEKDHRKIFTLSFHVDYWDRLGWRDPFSSSSYSDRQRRYAEVMGLTSVYTPQIVVNGKHELVGSDRDKLTDAVSKSLNTKATASFTNLHLTVTEGQKVAVDYEAKGDLKGCEIQFALVSKHESTSVKRGENGGRQLSHTNVVRQFITKPAEGKGSISFDSSPIPDTGNMLVVAYIQHIDDLTIIAAAETSP